MYRLRCVVVVLVWLSASSLMFAQESVGRITGIVHDPSGLVVANANVVLKNVATSVEVTTATDSAGAFAFPKVDIGEYNVTASSTGFKTSVRSGIRVIAGMAQTADFELEVGTATQIVNVGSKPTAVDLISSSMGTTMTTEEIATLPLQQTGGMGGGRAAGLLINSMPGANYVPNTPGYAVLGSVTLDGANMSLFSYTIDGVNAGVHGMAEDFTAGPIPEAVAEFRLSTSPNAEEGWNSGVNMSLVMKSGTNTLHGSVFEYVRNNKLDAGNWFTHKPSINKQNNFGVAIGGPVVIPKIYDGRNRTFFFGTWDGYRFRQLTSGVSLTVPTAKMRSGDFSEWLGPQVGTDALGRPIYTGEIYDSQTSRPDGNGGFIRDPFTYNGQLNVIDPARLSSISKFFQQYFPVPTSEGVIANWRGIGPASPTDVDRMTIKFDHEISPTQHLSFGYDDGWTRPIIPLFSWPAALNFLIVTTIHQPRFRANYTWNAKPNLLFGVNMSLLRWTEPISNPAGLSLGRQAGLTGPLTGGVPYTTIADLGAFGDVWSHLDAYNTNWPVNAFLALTRGRHSFKFGGEYLHMGETSRTDVNSDGSFTFGRAESGMPTFPSTGVGYASFLLGQVDAGSVGSPSNYKFTFQTWGLYAQDQWRVTNKLTLNYGLRWDLFVPAHESHDRIGFFDSNLPNPGAGNIPGAITFMGTGNGRNGRTGEVWDLYGKAFGPRFGFAYALNSKTVIRGNYGVVYVPEMQLNGGVNYGGIPAYGYSYSVSQTSLDSGLTPAFNWDNGAPFVLPTVPNADPTVQNGTGVVEINPRNNRPGMSQNISFGITRELPGNFVVKAEYFGNFTHHYSLSRNANVLPLSDYLSLKSLLLANINSPEAQAAGIPVPYPGFTGSVQQALKPFPQYTSVTENYDHGGFLLYNSAQFTVQKHFGQGLTLLASYSITKEFQNGPLATTSYPYPSLQNLKVLSNFDRPQILQMTYAYQLPVGQGKRWGNTSNPVLKQAIGGWEVSGVHSYMSGNPIRMGWVNLVQGQPIRTSLGCGNYDPGDPSRNVFLNINAFSIPEAFTVGNTNVLPSTRACGYMNENISVAKAFFVKERIRPRIGIDMFNAFNRHTWGGPAASIFSPPSFGRIFSVGNQPRTIQLFARLDF